METHAARLLRVPEIAARLQISKSKVYELIETGAMPHYRIGGSVRVAEEQLAAYLDGVKREPEERTSSPVRRARPVLKHLKL